MLQTTYRTVVQATSGHFYAVRDAGDGLDHAWIGVPVKAWKGSYEPKARARERLVRKLGCIIVREG